MTAGTWPPAISNQTIEGVRRGARQLFYAVAATVLLGACGTSSGSAPSPAAAQSPTAGPTGALSPSPSSVPSPQLAVGAPAWVSVSVASGWRSPVAPRPVDAPALENPVRIRAWLNGMSSADEVGLIDRLDTQALLGDRVLVLQLSGSWARVAIPDQSTPLDAHGYPVWIPTRQLIAQPPPNSGASVTVVAATAWLRSATTSLEVSFGTMLPSLEVHGSTDLVGVPGGASMTVDSKAVAISPLASDATAILDSARSFIGAPYLWGGTSGFGFDCSGLVHLVLKAHGVVVPRDSDPQSRAGAAVSRASLQPGDLVFFSSAGVAYHVAIYAGSGRVIDSPSPGYAVEEVALDSMPNIADFSGARRVTS